MVSHRHVAAPPSRYPPKDTRPSASGVVSGGTHRMSHVHANAYFPGAPAAAALAAMGSEHADPHTAPESAHHDRRYIPPEHGSRFGRAMVERPRDPLHHRAATARRPGVRVGLGRINDL